MSRPYLEKHVLICTDPSSCGPQGAEQIRDKLKAELKARNIRLRIRDGACSCMGLCLNGVNAVIWPEGTWLSNLSEADIPRLVDYLEGKGPRLEELESRADRKIEKKLDEEPKK